MATSKIASTNFTESRNTTRLNESKRMTVRGCITRYAGKLTILEMSAQCGIKVVTLRRMANKMGIQLGPTGKRKDPAPETIDRFLRLST